MIDLSTYAFHYRAVHMEENRIDALAKLTRTIGSRPPRANDLMLELGERESVIISILCMEGKPMFVENVRQRYIETAFEQVAYTVDLFTKVHFLSMRICEKRFPSALRGIPAPRENPYDGMLTKHIHEGAKEKAKILSELYHKYNPKVRKVPLLISAVTVQQSLNGLVSFYRNMVETRKSTDARTKSLYHINGQFLGEWQRQREESLEGYRSGISTGGSGTDPQVFFGLRNQMLRDAIGYIDEQERKFEAGEEIEKGKNQIDALARGISRRGIFGDALVLPYEGWLPEAPGLVLKGMDDVNAFVQQILSHSAPPESMHKVIENVLGKPGKS